MEERERQAIVAALDDKLAQRGSWCGETHLQKAVFFLQELFDVQTGFRFIFYKYGPFSRDLRGELSTMRGDGFLEVVPSPPYGPKLMLTQPAREQLIERHANAIRPYDGPLGFVAERLASLGVGDLERLAAALWVHRRLSEASEDKQAARINELKPHVSVDSARQALRDVAEMERAARAAV
ncbi:MAG TPA: hypothetical protein VFP23_09165 [Solirubrobacterales bacterium]|nr:hypothetical protein [Solirubrobacterales bacterium]